MKTRIILVTIFLCTLPNLANTQNLIAHWPFNGNANDVSGNGHNGVNFGATLTSGRFGNPNSAYQFDGIDDYIIIPHDSSLSFDIDDDFAISLWVKIAGAQNWTNSEANVIMSKWIDESGAGTNEGYPYTIYMYNQSTFWNGNGFLRPQRRDKVCNVTIIDTANSSILDQSFHHIVYQKNGDTLFLYIDNVLETKKFDGTTCNTINDDHLFFARKGGSTGPAYFTGIIDDAKIFDGYLSTSQINSLYTNTFSIDETDPGFVFEVFPNPASEFVRVNCLNPQRFVLMNIQGRQVWQSEEPLIDTQIILRDMPSGIYFLKGENGPPQKIIISH
jgi:hypothetical protein